VSEKQSDVKQLKGMVTAGAVIAWAGLMLGFGLGWWIAKDKYFRLGLRAGTQVDKNSLDRLFADVDQLKGTVKEHVQQVHPSGRVKDEKAVSNVDDQIKELKSRMTSLEGRLKSVETAMFPRPSTLNLAASRPRVAPKGIDGIITEYNRLVEAPHATQQSLWEELKGKRVTHSPATGTGNQGERLVRLSDSGYFYLVQCADDAWYLLPDFNKDTKTGGFPYLFDIEEGSEDSHRGYSVVEAGRCHQISQDTWQCTRLGKVRHP
jgi:hypothetical protein